MSITRRYVIFDELEKERGNIPALPLETKEETKEETKKAN